MNQLSSKDIPLGEYNFLINQLLLNSKAPPDLSKRDIPSEFIRCLKYINHATTSSEYQENYQSMMERTTTVALRVLAIPPSFDTYFTSKLIGLIK